jgi:hypothetical protein
MWNIEGIKVPDTVLVLEQERMLKDGWAWLFNSGENTWIIKV